MNQMIQAGIFRGRALLSSIYCQTGEGMVYIFAYTLRDTHTALKGGKNV